jgi:hypothetical protein
MAGQLIRESDAALFKPEDGIMPKETDSKDTSSRAGKATAC